MEKTAILESSVSKVVSSCQVCGSENLESMLCLGYLPPVNEMTFAGEPLVECKSFPAELLKCNYCQLVQLGCVVDQRHIFPESYPYVSGTTKILCENFAEQVEECTSIFLKPSTEDLVIDIGSNDGTLLSKWQPTGCKVYGIEPTGQANLAIARGIETCNKFFNHSTALEVLEAKGRAKIITAANVFAHIDDVDDIMEGIVALMAEDGIFISESHYLISLLEELQYDTVYHEHLRYYSLTSLKYLFEKHGLTVFHARRIPTHGGSIRVYVCKPGMYPVQNSVTEMLEDEAKSEKQALISDFSNRVSLQKVKLWSLLSNLVQQKKVIYGVGAPSRASTLVNYVGLDSDIIRCVLEIKGSPKIGKNMPGTAIPVVDETVLFSDQPDYALLFSWHIAEELIPKLKAKGFQGKFIVPLPEPKIIN